MCFVVLCHANSLPLLSSLLVMEVDGCTTGPEGVERVNWAASLCTIGYGVSQGRPVGTTAEKRYSTGGGRLPD